LFTFVSIQSCQFFKPDIIANADTNLATFHFKDGKGIAGRQGIALAKGDFAFNVNIEQMHL